MLATHPQVPNKPRKVGKKYVTINDTEVRQTVVLFLRDVIGALDEMRETDSSSAGRAFYPAATMLVRALLQQDEATKEYNRIGLFRKPRQEGRLMDMVLLQDTKSKLQSMVYR